LHNSENSINFVDEFIYMNPLYKNIKVIAFDADDTLWSNEPYFRQAELDFERLITPYAKGFVILDELFSTEMSNMALLGYGAKAFTISMVETAIRISNHQVPNTVITEIMNVGKSLLETPMRPLNGVVETLTYLQDKGYKLVVATKGEHRDQTNKLCRSGLEKYFDFVEVMQDKLENEYLRLLDILKVFPSEFAMVGNSFKSDIIPVLSIGAYGIHIPFEITWKHEIAQTFTHPNLTEISSFKELEEYF
jgi:putative hydrolase of the HAD superfamily